MYLVFDPIKLEEARKVCMDLGINYAERIRTHKGLKVFRIFGYSANLPKLKETWQVIPKLNEDLDYSLDYFEVPVESEDIRKVELTDMHSCYGVPVDVGISGTDIIVFLQYSKIEEYKIPLAKYKYLHKGVFELKLITIIDKLLRKKCLRL